MIHPLQVNACNNKNKFHFFNVFVLNALCLYSQVVQLIVMNSTVTQTRKWKKANTYTNIKKHEIDAMENLRVQTLDEVEARESKKRIQ